MVKRNWISQTHKLSRVSKLISPTQDLKDDRSTITAENETLDSSLSEVRAENLRLKGTLDEMNNVHDELSKELLSVRGQLKAEMSRCFKLEVQIAELEQSLESMQPIEDEVKSLRREISALEQERNFEASGHLERQSSSGVWQWIAGGARNA